MGWSWSFLLVLCFQLGISKVFGFNETAYIEVPNQGLLRGERIFVNDDMNVLFFGRVPFAAPPLEELRFSRPGPPPSWEGERDSTYWGPACPQNLGPIKVHEDFVNEDCLYMNIHTPEKTNGESNTYPVILFIQGGGFQLGSTMVLYGGNVLAEKQEVVLVNFNYRLGALGYLSTEDEAAYGNWGMWDQVAAMQWVKENIVLFNGDPNSITIYGHSAGAASVGFHLMSPQSQGLFHKAILESGSPLNRWAVKLPPHSPKDIAQELAVSMDCPTSPSSALVDCLRTKDAYNLTYMAAPLIDYDEEAWLPTVDGPGNFLPEDPFVMMKNGNYYKVPVMAGYTSSEWVQVSVAGITDPNAGMTREEFRQKITYKVLSRKFDSCSQVKYEDIINAMEFFHTPWNDPEHPILLRDSYIKLESDELFASGIHYFLMHMLGDSETPKYMYEFDFESKSAPYADYVAVPHVEDLFFVFGRPYKFDDPPELHLPLPPGRDRPTGRNFTEEDATISDVMMSLWGNFAKYGDPTPEGHLLPGVDGRWTNYSASDKGVFHINTESKMRHDFDFHIVNYWYDYDPKVEQSASNLCCDCVEQVDPTHEEPNDIVDSAVTHRYDPMVEMCKKQLTVCIVKGLCLT
ncbi:fatty acyl-CoA hydrolase precursor, medium chain-like [Glandiceps talaboti]